MTNRTLTPDELAALYTFAADYGRGWKRELGWYWIKARVYRDYSGREWPELHRLRNEFGPSWLASFKLPKD